jgi:hypothetical protein
MIVFSFARPTCIQNVYDGLLSEMACVGFEKLRDHAVEHLPGGEFANPTPHVVKAANTIGEATRQN